MAGPRTAAPATAKKPGGPPESASGRVPNANDASARPPRLASRPRSSSSTGLKSSTDFSESSAPRPSAARPLHRSTRPPSFVTFSRGKRAHWLARLEPSDSGAPVTGRCTPTQMPFMLARPAALAAIFRAPAAGSSLPLTSTLCTAKPPVGRSPDCFTCSRGPKGAQPATSRAHLAGPWRARPRTPSRLGVPSRQSGARPEPPAAESCTSSILIGSSACGTGCLVTPLPASPHEAADFESGSAMPSSPRRSMMSSKSQLRTSVPFTDLTTMPSMSPFSAACPRASPL
mmetsp:Transcript_24281/g.53984  ORF Transcript_24281/g.53984 Transcript_24281/m.53984 type:complete len:287 (+) Transcript_24281:319-1179(+)